MGGTYRSVRLPVRDVLARTPSPPSPVGTFSPARGDRTSPRARRKIEATDTFYKVCNFDTYPLVRAVRTGLLGYRYVDRPLPGGTAKIDLRWLIEGEKLKKKKRKIRKKKKEVPHFPALSLPTHRRHPRSRAIFLPREETELLPMWGERSRRFSCFCSQIIMNDVFGNPKWMPQSL
ncbi:hypothetical protein GW17_00045834, partial [Ensete ventricosum]